MRPLPTDDPVAWCVSQSVCHAAALCKKSKFQFIRRNPNVGENDTATPDTETEQL